MNTRVGLLLMMVWVLPMTGMGQLTDISEIELDKQAPQLLYANGWWNLTTVYFPKNPEYPFYIYLNEKQSQHLSDFKFKVEKE